MVHNLFEATDKHNSLIKDTTLKWEEKIPDQQLGLKAES